MGKIISVDNGALYNVGGVNYVNGKVVPDADGVYNFGGAIVTVSSGQVNRNVSCGAGGVSIGSSVVVGGGSTKNTNGLRDSGNYIVNTDCSNVEANFLVHGDLIITGDCNCVISGSVVNKNLPNIECKDLKITADCCRVGQILQVKGQVKNTGDCNNLTRQ